MGAGHAAHRAAAPPGRRVSLIRAAVDAHKPGWPVLLSSTAAANELGAWAKFKILCFFWLMFRSICKEARSGEFLFALLVV